MWAPGADGSGVLGGVHGGETTGRLLTAAEVGERLGHSERYVWRLGRAGTETAVSRDHLCGPGCRKCAVVEETVGERAAVGAARRPASTAAA